VTAADLGTANVVSKSGAKKAAAKKSAAKTGVGSVPDLAEVPAPF
jgi:hypothetical protein